MKVIELLDMIHYKKTIPKKIKIDDDTYSYSEFYGDYINVINSFRFQQSYNLFALLKCDVEIIEESKEELEEIELLDNRKAYEVIDLIDGITTKHKWEYCDVIQNTKINELIENQNKIIRELKANKENE